MAPWPKGRQASKRLPRGEEALHAVIGDGEADDALPQASFVPHSPGKRRAAQGFYLRAEHTERSERRLRGWGRRPDKMWPQGLREKFPQGRAPQQLLAKGARGS